MVGGGKHCAGECQAGGLQKFPLVQNRDSDAALGNAANRYRRMKLRWQVQPPGPEAPCRWRARSGVPRTTLKSAYIMPGTMKDFGPYVYAGVGPRRART